MESEYQQFIRRIREKSDSHLKGEFAQSLMAPEGRIKRALTYDRANAKQSAVLILLHEINNTPHLILIRRSADGGPHGGQISLPGGAYETGDNSISQTALRETSEEIGVTVKPQNILRALSPLYIPVSNFLVHPFVAFTESPLVFIPDPLEVASVHSIDPMRLINPATIKSKEFSTYDPGVTITAPYFHIDDLEIWGATSMILSEFSELIK